MTKKRILSIVFILISFCLCFLSMQIYVVKADALSDNISNQLENIDLSALENFINNLKNKPENFILKSHLEKILAGKYSTDYSIFIDFIFDLITNGITEILPSLLCVFSVVLFCGILQNFKSSFLSDGLGNIINFVCVLSVILILGTQLYTIWISVKNIIENIANFIEIMSPIILTLMIASGGKTSATVYKPAVAFLSSGVVNIMTNFALPLIAVSLIFNIISSFSDNVKLTKFSDFAISIFKWIVGITSTVFSLFLSVQGIASSSFDGISLRATKYAISNSIPIVGGFLRDGFDVFMAGSVLIKNSIGIIGIFVLFYIIIPPLIYMFLFSLSIKLINAVTTSFADNRISELFVNISKGISYLIAVILIIGVMLFITILLMIFSANYVL